MASHRLETEEDIWQSRSLQGFCPHKPQSISSLPRQGHQREPELWSSWGWPLSPGSEQHGVRGPEHSVSGSSAAIKHAGATASWGTLPLKSPPETHPNHAPCSYGTFCSSSECLHICLSLNLVVCLFKSAVHKVKHVKENKR